MESSGTDARNLGHYQWLWAGLAGVTLASHLPVSTQPAMVLLGHVVTLPLYMAFIAVSIGLLILPFTKVFPSIDGELKRTGWWVLDIVLCSLLLPHLLKFMLHLPRPSGSPSGTISGHTAFAFSLAWLIWKTFPRLGPCWFAGAVAIGWSRVQTEAHYPYQVPLGAVLGLVLGWAVTSLQDGVLLPRCIQLAGSLSARRARIAARHPAQS